MENGAHKPIKSNVRQNEIFLPFPLFQYVLLKKLFLHKK
jgi:hypothetical protein